MRTIRKLISFMFSRLFLIALMVIAQILFVIIVVYYFSNNAFYSYFIFHCISALVVIYIVSNRENPSYKITWIIALLAFPVTGGVFYILIGDKRVPAKLYKLINTEFAKKNQHSNIEDLCKPSDESLLLQSNYITRTSEYPVWNNTNAQYFGVGEDMFEQMLSELQRAKKFIFLEYFIIHDGFMWNTIFDILKSKVRDGVEVRLMYDDLGCITTLKKGYDKVIRDSGIKLLVFNPFRLRANVILNYRDHRKICIVDGHTAFCGGINLADEYINQKDRFGHWKDTGVMLKGQAVWSFTFMFLQQWSFSTKDKSSVEQYKNLNVKVKADGLVQPYGDTPLDDFNVTETAYLNSIARANKYVYITTPYLVIDYEMESALCAAALSGVDVRIVTPYIYDKKYVHRLTRSHYEQLILAGVKIYEYSPGFIHAKMLVSDDKFCIVGTCNMDFRSFYLHFECSVAFYNSSTIDVVKQDMIETQAVSNIITIEDTQKISWLDKIICALLKIFAPLM